MMCIGIAKEEGMKKDSKKKRNYINKFIEYLYYPFDKDFHIWKSVSQISKNAVNINRRIYLNPTSTPF